MEPKNSETEQVPQIVQGYLKKLKNENALIRFVSKFTKRWFVLDITSGLFYYCKSHTKKNPIKQHQFSEITGFVRDLVNIELSEWRFTFKVETTTKEYTLYCETYDAYESWCKAFQTVIKSVTNNIPTISENNIQTEFGVRRSFEPNKRFVPPNRSSCSIDFSAKADEKYKERMNSGINPLLRKAYKENEEPWGYNENVKAGLLSGVDKGRAQFQTAQRSDSLFTEEIGNQTPSFPLKSVENAPRQRAVSLWDAPSNSRLAEISSKPGSVNWC